LLIVECSQTDDPRLDLAAQKRSVLISGIGIAGPTLAYWLGRYGFSATLVENAPRLRTGGYLIHSWGRGFDVGERMGILPLLNGKASVPREKYIVKGVVGAYKGQCP
jgi:2-polyprenyl-6-methoxyphenol hydroxylase-like FAD-dependent oxidoreductase